MILLALKRIHPSPFFIYLFLKCYHIASHEICMLTSSLLSRILLSFMKFEIYTTERSSWVPSNNRLNVELLSVRYKTNSFFFPPSPLPPPLPPFFSFFFKSTSFPVRCCKKHTSKASQGSRLISSSFKTQLHSRPHKQEEEGEIYVEHASSLTYHATSSRVLLVDDASPCTKNGNIIL